MAAEIISGKEIAATIRKEITVDVISLKEKSGGKDPGLAVVLVGEDPASAVYVRNKKKACEEVGIRSIEHNLPAETTEKELLDLIQSMNDDPSINGILVQLPLPKHISEEKLLLAISPIKDVDGFHPENVGKLAIGGATLVSCTPAGIIEMLDRTGIEISGKKAVIVGRSNIVGKPISLLLLHRHATVTICHSKTCDLAACTVDADILVAAIGRPKFITGDMVKPGAVVIDVGINRSDEGLVGDVDFEAASKVASHITPVPGGVGPMTITMLLKNTVIAFKDQNNIL